MCTELGIVLGFFAGSTLYNMGGYTLPFYVNAGAMILIILLI